MVALVVACTTVYLAFYSDTGMGDLTKAPGLSDGALRLVCWSKIALAGYPIGAVEA